MNIEISQLFIHHPEKSRRASRVFISKNFPEREKILGKLFGIIEIETDTPDKKKYQILDTIINNLENNFYYHEKLDNLSFGKPIEKIDAESIFESALQKLNDKIINLIQGENTYLPLNKLHLIFGVEKDNRLYFTAFGQVHAFLMFIDKHNDYKMTNIIESTKEPPTAQNKPKSIPSKIFSNIISGKLNLNNSLLFSTNSLFDYLSFDRLKKTIIRESPNKAAEEFRAILSKVSSYVTLAAIIIKLTPKSIISEEKIALPQHSINKLLSTEEKTKKFLTPSLKINYKKYLEIIKKKLKGCFIFFFSEKIKIKDAPREPLHIPPNKIQEEIKKTENESASFFIKTNNFLKKLTLLFFTNFNKSSIYLKYIGIRIFHFVIRGIKTKSKIIENFIYHLFNKLLLKLDNLIEKINRLSKLSKIFLTISFILFFLFLQSLVYLGQSQEGGKSSLTYNQINEQILDKIDKVEASIIYNNEDRAKIFLLEAQDLLKELPKNTRKQKKNYKSLSDRMQTQFEKLRHAINISEPALIVNFASLAEENKKIDIKGLVSLDNNLYAFDGEKKIIYQIDPNKKEINNINIYFDNLNPLELGIPADRSSIIFYTENKELTKLDLNEKNFKPLAFPLGTNSEIKDLALYNNRLYSLDIKNNQIYRHGKTAAGYLQGIPWLREKGVDLTNGVSLTIDTSIYTLKSNGEIFKFNNGYKRNFEAENIDPPLNNPQKIWTSINSNFLYILDPPNKRIVIFNKEGRLKNQYYSPQFDDLRDFIVMEKEKKIYLLNGAKVFGIMASHL